MADKIALVFPGQGSQVVGMGRDIAQAYPAARETFAEADQVLGFPLSQLCFEGPDEALQDTYNTQPAIFTTSIAILHALQSAGFVVQPVFLAGHSLGEYSALVASGALTFTDGLRLVRERGRLMKLAGERDPGGMAAVLKLDDQTVEEICRQASAETGRIVQIANYNAPGQVVISGHNEALERAIQLAEAAGARRVIRLAVSIASHSPLMAGITSEFRQAVWDTPLQRPQIAVVGNVTARPLTSAEEIREEMVRQLTSSVRWVESIAYIAAQGVGHCIEIGPKDVLTGLISRIHPEMKATACGTLAAIQALI